jgi:hypothetical protein
MSVDNIRVLFVVAVDAILQSWSSTPLWEGAKMSLTVYLEAVLLVRSAPSTQRTPALVGLSISQVAGL